MPNRPHDPLEEAERLKRLVVEPMIDAMKLHLEATIKPVVDATAAVVSKVERHEARIIAVEKQRNRALAGYAVYATAVGVGMSAAWKWVTSKIHVS